MKRTLGQFNKSYNTKNPLKPVSKVKKKLKQFKTRSKSLSTGIQVYCRFRPPSGQRDENMKIFLKTNTVEISTKAKSGKNKYLNSQKFQFTKLFDEKSSQEQVFKNVCHSMLKDVFTNFKSGVIFSYGVTNAGKTHTIIGNKNQPGLLAKFIDVIYELKSKIESQNQNQEQTSIFKSNENDKTRIGVIDQIINFQKLKNLEKLDYFFECFEIYNEDIYDLTDLQNIQDKQKLEIKEIQDGTFILKDLMQHELTTIQECQTIIQQALDNRQCQNTLHHKRSSRSHTVYKITFHFTFKKTNNKMELNEKYCCLQFIDLAGSERQKSTKSTGKQIKEACNINRSLLYLGQCIETIKMNQSLKKKKIIPYRNCKLTKLLYSYFHEDKSMSMIVNINPCKQFSDESKRVLEYASLAKQITPLRNKWAFKLQSKNTPLRVKKFKDPRQNMTPTGVQLYDNLLERQCEQNVKIELQNMKKLTNYQDTLLMKMVEDLQQRQKRQRFEDQAQHENHFKDIEQLLSILFNNCEPILSKINEQENINKNPNSEKVEKMNNACQTSFRMYENIKVKAKSVSKAKITFSKAKKNVGYFKKFKKKKKRKNPLNVKKKGGSILKIKKLKGKTVEILKNVEENIVIYSEKKVEKVEKIDEKENEIKHEIKKLTPIEKVDEQKNEIKNEVKKLPPKKRCSSVTKENRKMKIKKKKQAKKKYVYTRKTPMVKRLRPRKNRYIKSKK